MSAADESRLVLLDRLPAQSFVAAVTYLADVLRECQLVLVGQIQGEATDPALATIAEGLVPDLEEVRDEFTAATVTPQDDGTVRLETRLVPSQAATLVHLQMLLIQLRLLGRRGGLLVRSDPEVSQLIAWIWDEVSDQLHGRPPRPYRAAT